MPSTVPLKSFFFFGGRDGHHGKTSSTIPWKTVFGGFRFSRRDSAVVAWELSRLVVKVFCGDQVAFFSSFYLLQLFCWNHYLKRTLLQVISAFAVPDEGMYIHNNGIRTVLVAPFRHFFSKESLDWDLRGRKKKCRKTNNIPGRWQDRSQKKQSRFADELPCARYWYTTRTQHSMLIFALTVFIVRNVYPYGPKWSVNSFQHPLVSEPERQICVDEAKWRSQLCLLCIDGTRQNRGAGSQCCWKADCIAALGDGCAVNMGARGRHRAWVMLTLCRYELWHMFFDKAEYVFVFVFVFCIVILYHLYCRTPFLCARYVQ